MAVLIRNMARGELRTHVCKLNSHTGGLGSLLDSNLNI